jgi:hypothetical protein
MAMEQSRRLLKAESARDKGKPPSAGRGRHESCVRPNNSGKSNVPLFFSFSILKFCPRSLQMSSGGVRSGTAASAIDRYHDYLID